MNLPVGFAAPSADATPLPLHVVDRAGLADWRAGQPAPVGAWLDAHGFDGAPGTAALLPGAEGAAGAVIGVGDRLDPFSYAHAPLALPPHTFRLAANHDADALEALRVGWGLGAYRFSRYRRRPRPPAPVGARPAAAPLDALAAPPHARHVVNTPPAHTGPDHLRPRRRAVAAPLVAVEDSTSPHPLRRRSFGFPHA